MTDRAHLYIVTYDISDPKRWRRVFKLMHGYGEWVQLSVFQCRLTRQRHAELVALLDGMIHHDEDHVVVMDMGPAERVEPRIVSLGHSPFEVVGHEPIIV
jgi:CRISPR-associated protein Cas2